MNIKIIGLGGIGSIFSEKLCRFLNYSVKDETNVTLVDGDIYEDKNLERQEFSRFGNKSEVKKRDLMSKFNNIDFESFPHFIDRENILEVINEEDLVFLCVDNHKTRQIVSDYCKSLKNVSLISGGNDFEDGNVQLYLRKNGKDLTPDLCTYHPEIRRSEDMLPSEMSCEELSRSEPQLYFANLSVATIMCWVFYNLSRGNHKYSEVYFDIPKMSLDSKIRKVKNRKGEF